MSSIIVLDSSDEDESPPKKANVKSTTDYGYNPSVTNSSSSKGQNAKPRAIPSGITITPRLSPTSLGAKSVNMQSLNTSSLAASFIALNSIINDERQTPTPPKGLQAPGLNQRKRKTPTPPQSMQRLTAKNFATMTNSSPAKAATTVAPLPPIMPMITGVHSMAAAGATPPLQLMATPPHNLGAFMGLNEQLMINPHLISSGLPPNTTITAHPNPNQNNINNNFKIHLPFNRPTATTTTPSPAASPASSAPKTPSPQLTPSPQPGRADRNSRRIKPTTLLKSSDESWQRHKQNDKPSQRTPISLSNDVVIEMLPPSTESPKSISASSSRHHTPMTSPTTPKSRKSPDVINLTTPTNHHNIRKDCDTVLDLTHSPDKVKNITTTPIKPTEIVDLVNTPEQQKQQINGEANTTKPDKKPDKPPPKPPLEPEYEELIKVCREADPSKDMEKLIKSRLIKYYYEVHSDFVKSKSFRKSIHKVVESIKAKPDLVYLNLKTIVEELKVRRKARLVEEATAAAAINATETTTSASAATNNNSSAESPATEKNSAKNTTTSESNVPATSSSTSSTSAANISATATASTGNKKLDEQIKKLNRALYVLTKRIEVLEQAEVDWDDDDSSFLQVERFKKRACQIYEKICDLTGESKNAHRLVKKPIKFNETRIPQFNKTLQAFINRTKEFPDYYDVLRMLEHCNRTYSLGLVNFEMKNIAEDAFIKVGKLLQSRRKADLYETVTHYAGDGADPAKADPALAAKLNENLKNHKKINDILEKFARKQDMPDVEEEEEKAEKTENSAVATEAEVKAEVNVKMETETETAETTSKTTTEISNIEDQKMEEDKKPVLIKSEESKNETETSGVDKMVVDNEDEEDDDDEDDEEEEDDEENLDEQVETLANGDVSDNESDNEIDTNKDKTNITQDSGKQNESLEIVEKSLDTTNNDKSLTECIEIHDNSHDILSLDVTMKNCMAKDASTIVKINSETDSVFIRTNNNNDLEVSTTKNVINTAAATEESSLPSSPLSSPIPPASITPTRNGKLKDTPPPSHHLLNNNSNATKLCTATATTTTADLKIVHVSSLEPDSSNNDVIVVDNNHPALINRNEVGSNLCTDLTSPTPANKSLEEIVISDEES
ncbi:daxx-like protein [Calliphora vicina]|uniref:daxx-like protein n=1 Tax=Calliphora vicina TaxID=7373 RepID=UPI00325A4E80